MEVQAIRRENLAGLIRDRFENNRAAFCRATGRHPNLINLVLSKNPEFQRNVGEKLARMIEADLGLPDGWLDIQGQTSINSSSVQFRVAELDGTATAEKLQISAPHLDRPTSLDAVVAVRVPSGDLAPQLLPQDLLLVDTGQTSVAADGVYIVKTTAGHFIRRVSKLMTGGFRVTAGADSTEVKKIEVLGRAVGSVLFRPIV